MKRANSLDNPRILLMCRDAALSAQRKAQLARAGWHAVPVDDPVVVLSHVRAEEVDLVLLQIPLEEMIEMDLPNVLHQVYPNAYLPVVVLDAGLAPKDRCRFLESGADEFITRDMTADEMIARIRVVLRIKDLHDRLCESQEALEESLRRERALLDELRQDNAHLKTLATTDPLTKVENVRSWREVLDHEFRMAKRYSHPLSLLMFDVDHFKLVNDTYGHPSGDYVLKELAVILKQSLRESDVVARVGGEEFSVVLPRADRRQAEALALRIRQAVRDRWFSVYGHEFCITISVGAATYPQDAEITDPQMLWYFADHALLAAKDSGRDRLVTVQSLRPKIRRRLGRQFHQMSEEGNPQTAIVPVHP